MKSKRYRHDKFKTEAFNPENAIGIVTKRQSLLQVQGIARVIT